MDAEAAPPRSVSSRLRGAFRVARGAWSHAARLALDIALPTRCGACREPVHGDGVCATCWAKLSFIAPPFCPRLGIPFIYDPGPGMLSMEAIADPPAYARARAAGCRGDGARAADPAADRPVAQGARQQCARCIQGRRRPAISDSRSPRGPDRR